MSKRNRFNKFRKNRGRVSENVSSQKESEKIEKKEEKKDKEYNMKSDFLSLGIIFAVFIGALVGLYYYDKQSNILATVTEQLMKMFG
jgi:lipid II:glycine glycyltransferase (peptidoglycan interpeptide bridge formation enzyme)